MAYIASGYVATDISSTQLTVIANWQTPEICLTTLLVSP